MRQRNFIRLVIAAAIILILPAVTPVVNSVHADQYLIGQGTSTHGTYNLIYDTDLDITWYDYTNAATTWQNQVAWASALSVDFGGNTYTDWRLPTTVDGPFVYGYDGTTTAGYNITNGEMGHLYYTELGNVGEYDTSGNPTGCGSGCLINTSDFQNLLPTQYWSSTSYLGWSDIAWRFIFDRGIQYYGDGNDLRSGIAVHDGFLSPDRLNLIGQGTSTHGTYNLIYDTDLDITWYDYTNAATTWQNQVAWASALSVDFGGNTYTDWRLPTTVDGPFVYGYDGTTTAGYNITNGEMGHLYYTELGNVGEYDTSGNPTGCGSGCLINTSDFQNLLPTQYWSSTSYLGWSDIAWRFIFDRGIQYYGDGNDLRSGIAVHDGFLSSDPPDPVVNQLPATGQTTSYAAGDDGDLQMGAAWPTTGNSTSGRFDCDADTCTDLLTGLTWLKNANCIGTQYQGDDIEDTAGDGKVSWFTGRNFIINVNNGNRPNCAAGQNDWRMPNINELHSLLNYGTADMAGWLSSEGFQNVQSDNYWVSTAYTTSTTNGWAVRIALNSFDIIYEDLGQWGGSRGGHESLPNWNRDLYPPDCYDCSFPYVWLVRGGPDDTPDAAYPANVLETGQKTSGYSGDDGDLEWGVSAPTSGNSTSGRFTDNGNDTMTDLLTGLMWTKSGNVAYPEKIKSFQGALDYISDMNNGTNLSGLCATPCSNFGYTDWKLPNVVELRSLLNFEFECQGLTLSVGSCPASPFYGGAQSYLNWEGFTQITDATPEPRITTAGYWSSTSDASNTNRAYTVAFGFQGGVTGTFDKTSTCVTSGVYPCPSWGPNPSGWFFWPVRDDIAPPPGIAVSGSGRNYPASLRASLAIDADSRDLVGSSLRYYYTGSRMDFVSTSITSVTGGGGTVFIAGTGNATKAEGAECIGCSFTVTIIDGSPDEMGMQIDGGTYYDEPVGGGTRALTGGNFTIVE